MYELMDLKDLERDRPILKTECDAIINFVPCDGVMGRGIGAVLRSLHPEMDKSYINACFNEVFTSGKIIIWRKSSPWIINIPSRLTWKDNMDSDFIEKGFIKLSTVFKNYNIKTIAYENDSIPFEILKNNLESIELPKFQYYDNETYKPTKNEEKLD
jgi:hypothetical protein